MNEHTKIENQLQYYLEQFTYLHQLILEDSRHIVDLENLIDEYSQWILQPLAEHHYLTWNDLETKISFTKKLQEVSAKCVKQVEVIRAQRLLNGRVSTSGYFENIEHCINEEFGRWQIGQNDKLLLIGSGAYPMTLIQVAKETGAAVIGIDIDSEAVDLGQRVVNVLAPNEDIVISNQTVDQLEDIQSVTHIIFSSTIPIKYDILNELYTLTNDEVVVAMRYGDDMKALFNYPSQATDETQWRCEELQTRPKQIFDIALYRKVTSKVGVEHV